MRIYGAKGTRFNFADRKVTQESIKWFGVESERDLWLDHISPLWDITEPKNLEVPLPEIDVRE